ncbi:hypothetical protein KSP40_PGU011377 [Platanthera guangdongensis]|uniref:Uncharacterized protein n=1 Tax=Platanthera guangdongensis TaxID=2320717 RepID=A0ABR2LLB9_9ASPA
MASFFYNINEFAGNPNVEFAAAMDSGMVRSEGSGTTMDFQRPPGARGNVPLNLGADFDLQKMYEGEVLLAVGSCFSHKGSGVVKMEATKVIMCVTTQGRPTLDLTRITVASPDVIRAVALVPNPSPSTGVLLVTAASF